jgi:hypothetical protein
LIVLPIIRVIVVPLVSPPFQSDGRSGLPNVGNAGNAGQSASLHCRDDRSARRSMDRHSDLAIP